MEQNNVETLEEVEVTEMKTEDQVNHLKEYEKLLIEEANREDLEKAINLVKFGCFEQKEQTEVDFSNYEVITAKKKYKGLYTLYRDLETMQLVFICPLVENNKGDKEENKEMKPYAFDCIYVETMDNETYQMVCKAAKNNISNVVSFLYKSSFVCYITLLVFTLFAFIFNLISYASSGFWAALGVTFFYTGALIAGCVITLPLLVLVSIKYKNYKDQ